MTQALRLAWLLLAAALTLLLAWRAPAALVRFDEGLRDAVLRALASQTVETRLTIVDIDEDSLRQVGPWPWPRERLADVIELLLGPYAARAVGLDVVLPEAGSPAGEQRLAALARHAPLTLAQVFDYVPREPPLQVGVPGGGQPAQTRLPALRAYGFVANHAALAEAPCIGNVGFVPDDDGVLRRLPLRTRYGERDYLHFAAALLACAGQAPPLPQTMLWRIPFRRALTAYPVVSAGEVLTRRAPPELLAGRYVLVGSSSLGLGDRVSTPLAPLASGVAVHAAALAGLLDLAAGQGPAGPYFALLPLLWLGSSLALVGWALGRWPAWGNALLLLGLAFGWLALAAWGTKLQAEWPFGAPLAGYVALLATAVPGEWWLAQRRARRLVATFSHYVAPAVLEQILRQNLLHSLAPARREVTVLIADMEGYTRTVSALALEEAAQLTRDFLDCLTRPVLAHGGTLDKYSGDGLVAFWGAPLDCPDQADRAVGAALDICAAVAALNRRRSTPARLRVRIGIESGWALVGDLGTPFRSTYTAVGDCINFAARLEAAARELASDVVIGPNARSKLREHPTRPLGRLALRGTPTVIEVYGPLG